MAATTIRPSVTVDNNPNPYVASSLVGGTGAAADDSDATYGEVWSSRRTGIITNDYVRADFDTLSIESLDSVTLELRYELTSDGGTVTPLDVFAWSGATQLGSFANGTPTVGTVVTETFAYTAVEPLSAFLSALISGDLYLTLGPGEHMGAVGTDKMLRVYEIGLTVVSLSPCYKTLTASVVDGTASVSDPAYATLPVYTGPTVLDLTLGFTATSSDKDTITFAGIWGGWNGSTVDTDLAVTIDLPITADGSPHDYTHTFSVSEYGETLADIRAALADTGNAAVRFEASSGSVTFSDVWVQVGHKCRTVYPLRRHPRADGYGLGPKRHYPPPESQRKAGGYK